MAKTIDHSSRSHALLSASGAHRWLKCTPSAQLEERFMKSGKGSDGSSDYAKEGTLAHEFGDLNLRHLNGEISKSVLDKELAKQRKSKYYTDEMEGEVEKYVNFVWERLLESRQTTPDAELVIEQKVDFSHIVPEGFGSDDAIVIGNGVMDVMDLKYGKGVQVDAEKNPQLMLYGIGALNAFEFLYDIQTIRLTIIQPRLDHYSTWELSVDELMAWAEDIVKPIALKAFAGEGKKFAGDHCKFCKVKALCKTFRDKNLELARFEFEDADLMSDADLIEVRKALPMLIDWASSVDSYLLDEAVKGKKFKGLKVVEGRSMRKWANEAAVKGVLDRAGYSSEEYLKMSLEGITKVEKLLGKPEFKKLLAHHIVKPQGKPTLAPESDKRPAFGLEQALNDFDD